MKNRKLSLLFLLGALTLCFSVHAKKIKYGTQVLYDGKAKKNIPTGEGTLTTTAGTFTDILMGNFMGDGSVTNAQLKFPSGWKFKGTLNYEVEIDGSKVTYTLKNGDLYLVSASMVKNDIFDTTLKIDSLHPVTLVRTPLPTSIDLKKFVFDFVLPGTMANDDFPEALSLWDIGDKKQGAIEASCTILPTSKVNNPNGLGTDPMRNLIEKDFAGITEPWTFLYSSKMVIMADGTKIQKMETGNELDFIIETSKDDIFMYHWTMNSSKITHLLKTYGDGRKLGYIDDDEYSDTWILHETDKSRKIGDVIMKNGSFIINNNKSLRNYDVKTVFNTIMKSQSLDAFSPKLINGTIVKADSSKVDVIRGYTEDQLNAREEARQKAIEERTPLTLEKIDLTGVWRMKNVNQPFSSFSYYMLTINDDNTAKLTLTTDYYATYAVDYASHPYYVSNEQSVMGTYNLSGENIIFNWNYGDKKDSGMKLMYECKDNYPKSLNKKAIKMSRCFDTMVSQLGQVRASNVSERYITLKDQFLFSRFGDNDAETKAALQEQREENFIKYSVSSGNIESLHYQFKDATLDISGGKMTINYANGDKYEGTGHVAIFASDGTMAGNTLGDRFNAYSQFAWAIINNSNIADLEIYYDNGTLTKANGKTLTFTKGLSDKQNNQIVQNLERVVEMINETAAEELKVMKAKTLVTKQILLSEGFAPYYVNSIFDNFRILEGTPQTLIDRAIQLGCHMIRHPVTLSDVEFNVRKSGKTYAIVITNYNTGADAFDGYVKFHWASHRVIYVGHQIR